jgi:hypothetical protein
MRPSATPFAITDITLRPSMAAPCSRSSIALEEYPV